MNNVDLIAMIGNLSRSLESVDNLVRGLSYLTGIALVYSGLFKIKKIVSSNGNAQEHYPIALGFIIAGSMLLFFPTTLRMASNTVFGMHNILQYTDYNQWNIYESMGVLIQTVGLIWFVRGCIMVVHANKPGEDHSGIRGFFFILSGILAVNFTLTMSAIDYVVNHLILLSITYNK